MIINGRFNKREFIEVLNNALFMNLNNNLKQFIKYIFPNIHNNDLIKCRKSNYRKINVIVSVRNNKKNISIKSGSSSIVYKDNVFNFIMKLDSLNVSYLTLKSIISYHFADGTTNGSGSVFSHGELLKLDYKNEIEVVKNEFKDKELLLNVINEFMIEDRLNLKVDYFYYGNVRKGYYISSSEFKERLLNYNDNYPHNFMMIGPFNFVSFNRDNQNEKFICMLKINNILKFIKK